MGFEPTTLRDLVNINRLFASMVKKNRLPLNNRFGGQLKFLGGNQGKYTSIVW